jgi:hypothetical protein
MLSEAIEAMTIIGSGGIGEEKEAVAAGGEVQEYLFGEGKRNCGGNHGVVLFFS